MVNPDIAIIGGGPAGLAAAIALRRKGCRVVVYDCVVPPADKACGEGMMPDALAALARLGVRIGGADSFPFRGVRFIDRGTRVAASFQSGPGRGVRRTTLHRILADHAEAAGVTLCWGAHPDLDKLRYGWLIGADGENSLVRKWAGLDVYAHDRRRFGFRRHYRIQPWSDHMELHWGNGYQVYVTPVSADSVCVAAISMDSQFRLDDALAGLPELANPLAGGTIRTAERGAVTSSRKLKAVYRDRVALIGDASGSVDAITGEGLCLAFRQAAALAEAIERGDLAEYQRAHRRIARRAEWMARLLLSLGEHEPLRRAAMLGLSAHPGIFAKLLAIHVGAYEIDDTDASNLDAGLVRAGDRAPTRRDTDPDPVHAGRDSAHRARLV
jgi:flavin-dependent dehydrogenase